MISRRSSGLNVQPGGQTPPLPDDVEQEESSSATDDEDVEEIMFAQKNTGILGVQLCMLVSR